MARSIVASEGVILTVVGVVARLSCVGEGDSARVMIDPVELVRSRRGWVTVTFSSAPVELMTEPPLTTLSTPRVLGCSRLAWTCAIPLARARARAASLIGSTHEGSSASQHSSLESTSTDAGVCRHRPGSIDAVCLPLALRRTRGARDCREHQLKKALRSLNRSELGLTRIQPASRSC